MINESCDQIAEMQQKLGHTIQSFSIDYLVEQYLHKIVQRIRKLTNKPFIKGQRVLTYPCSY